MLSHNETQSNLMAELDNLRQRIAQLEQEHTHYRQRIAQLEQERAQQTRHQEQLQLALEASQVVYGIGIFRLAPSLSPRTAWR